MHCLTRALAITLCAMALTAQPVAFLPLDQIHPGQRGVGRTVFDGVTISEFQVEILGILPNTAPKQSIILARLIGPEVDKAGVLAGMSGSPVYIDGKLIGAVALGFNYSKEPIAGIRPIDDMTAPVAVAPARASLDKPVDAIPIGDQRLINVATPISFSGFSRATIDAFAPQLRKLGLEPRQSLSGGSGTDAPASSKPLQPGAMISVQLMNGDFAVGADGTVTHLDGRTLYAFGHEFLQLGPVELPFARARVLALLPSVQSSFKISAAEDFLGTITSDGSTAIRGELGRTPDLVPLTIRVQGPARSETYRMNLARHPLLTPFLLQMAAYSAVETTQRTLGTSTVTMTGSVRFRDGLPDLKLDATASGDYNMAQQISQSAAFPLQAVLQGDFPNLAIAAIDLTLHVSLTKHDLQIDELVPARRTVQPGDTLPLTLTLLGADGVETRRTINLTIPAVLRRTNLTVTVSDALGVAFQRYARLIASPSISAREWIENINHLAQPNRLYLRVTRADSAYQVNGEELPSPPSSVAQLLNREQPPGLALINALRPALVYEQEVPFPGFSVSGTKSVQIEVKDQ